MSPLFEKTLALAASRSARPRATYRVQLHAGFTFRDAAAIVPYLAALGITHLYCSPYLAARPGSTHGYDVIDHGRLNPELGTHGDFDHLVATLRAHGMGHILDIVPNHAGIATNDNAWWNDVLEHGPASPFAAYFDITWRGSPRADLHDRVLLPLLGGPYASVLEKGELKLSFDAAAGTLSVNYWERRFPLSPCSYAAILRGAAGAGAETRGQGDKGTRGHEEGGAAALRALADAFAGLPDASMARAAAGAPRQVPVPHLKQRLGALCAADPGARGAIDAEIARLNGVPGAPASFDDLDALLARQNYRLAYWRVAPDEINYRRFFDINDLAALATERAGVFEATHALVFDLLARGDLDGVRIDHPDGLYDPAEYFRRLQRHYLFALAKRVHETEEEFLGQSWHDARAGVVEEIDAWLGEGAEGEKDEGGRMKDEGVEGGQNVQRSTPNAQRPAADGAADRTSNTPLYTVAEKILAPGEPLPEDWAVDGTTGYDALAMINGLFVDPRGCGPLTQLYEQFSGGATAFEDLVYVKKLLILDIALASELTMLAHRLADLARRDRASRDFTHAALRHALREVIACFPVYRTYVTGTAEVCAPAGEEGSAVGAQGSAAATPPATETGPRTTGSARAAAPTPAMVPAASSFVCHQDRAAIRRAIDAAIARNPAADRSVFDYLRSVLTLEFPRSFGEQDQADQVRFVGKFQQLTAPATAKGIEDTAFYLYHRLISLNEVGGEPGHFGVTPAALHDYFARRQATWPGGLTPLSTHDTKRSEDVRARINVLSEIPDEWAETVLRWRAMNGRHKEEARRHQGAERSGGVTEHADRRRCSGNWQLATGNSASGMGHQPVKSAPGPSANDEYLLYQTLVGAFPLEALPPQPTGSAPATMDNGQWTIDNAAQAATRDPQLATPPAPPLPGTFVGRIQQYMSKALREGKRDTSWTNPDQGYESAVADFVARLLDPARSPEFLADLSAFAARVSHGGLLNSLAQTLLRCTAPGVPDTYQGTELVDLSLVDPDNRRPVDYALRRRVLEELARRPPSAGLAAELLARLPDGRAKLYVLWRALSVRNQTTPLFIEGDYVPLEPAGQEKEHLFAFARRLGGRWAVVLVPRLIARLTPEPGALPLGPAAWGDTRIPLPPGAPAAFTDAFTGRRIAAGGCPLAIRVAEALADFPVALLISDG